MGLHPLDYVVLVAYFVIIAAIGFISTRLIKNREDYLMGGRRFGKAMMIMFAFGAGTHADSAIGVTAQSYRYGLAGIWYQFIMVFTMPIYWLIAPIFRRARVLTTADFFQRRFGSEMMYVYSAFSLFVLLSFNGVMLFGSGKLVEALTGHAIPWRLAVVIMGIIAFLYAIAGGLIAAVWNDFFQGILTIVMSLLIIPFFWSEIGGLEGFQAAIAEQANHPETGHIFKLVLGENMTVFWIVMMSISSLISMVAQPQILASTAAGKSEMDSRVGFVGGMILKRVMTIPWALTGVMAIALLGYSSTTDADHVFGLMSAKLLPSGCIGLMLACVMASVMDNCAVNMLSFSGIYTNSIHNRLIASTTDERKLVFINRLASVSFALASLGLSFLFTDVPGAMRFLWQTVPLMGIPWFFMILWRRTTRWGAIASFFAALAASGVANYVLGWKGDAGLPYTISLYLAAGIGTGIIVSLLTRPESTERIDQFFLLLKTPVGQEHLLREAGFRELPGSDTYDLPVNLPPEPRGFDGVRAAERDDQPQSGGLATAVAVSPVRTRVEYAEALSKIDNRQSRRETIYGFIVTTIVMLALLIGVKALATWLAP